MIIILGPTATGKTSFAANLALELNGEIISADSRQVYRGMDIGTGKDYDDYRIGDKQVPYHLVDIADPGYEYNVFEFQQDFYKAYKNIISRKKLPVLCGGTGMYIESVIKGYRLNKVPENKELRKELELKPEKELTEFLKSFRKLHNITDISDRKRLIRAIEIELYERENPTGSQKIPVIDYLIFGIRFEREVIRKRISERLSRRLEEGMVDEAKRLLDSGLTPVQLKFYGLEYRYLTEYITGVLSYKEMYSKLEIAIHQFAKRQMTWFRKMEREGAKIHWIDGLLSMNDKLSKALKILMIDEQKKSRSK